MHEGLALPSSHAAPGKRCQKSARLVVGMCLLAMGGCAPGYDDYADASDRPVSGARRVAAAATTSPPRRPIQPPAYALVEPTPKPDCENPDRPSGLGAAGGQQTASISPQPPSSDGEELAQRIKLEYEKQCYKQAEQRVRERLQGLQAWTAETMKASGVASETTAR